MAGLSLKIQPVRNSKSPRPEQGHPHEIDDPATRRILARVAVSESVARRIAELAFRPNADAWQRGRA